LRTEFGALKSCDFFRVNLSGENQVIRTNSTIFSLVELGNLSELGRKPEKRDCYERLSKEPCTQRRSSG
jgi:hypothetical protein